MIAIAAFCALFFLSVPFPAVIACAAILGTWLLPHGSPKKSSAKPDLSLTVPTIVIGIAIWITPIVLLAALDAEFLSNVAIFFSKLAVVTFGAAYAVLAYMTQEVVADLGWLTTSQMMDALGLAETTPGPLILVTQFVAMIAGFGQGGVGLAIAAGALTLWVTFVPCFIWIFAGAPLIDWLEGQARLQAALMGITAAVVGVIANLSLWFALHVMFRDLTTTCLGPVCALWPNLATINVGVAAITTLAAYLILWRHWGLVRTMVLCAAIGFILKVFV